MPTPTKGPRLGGSPAHQRLILSNLATQLFEHGRITTTESRARALRPFAEKLFEGVPPDEAFKIAAGNVLSFFRLAETPMGQKLLGANEAGHEKRL